MRAAQRAGLTGRVALVAGCMLLVLGAVVVLATGGRGQKMLSLGHSAVESRFASLGFRLGVVHLQGASRGAQGEILKAASLTFGAPILAIDLAAVRTRVERVGWVERAHVVRLLPDTLVIAIDQRPLLAVWEHAGRVVVIAADGDAMTRLSASHFAGLPLIVGDGANLAARAILPSILDRPRLARRMDALVRVDGRRWDVRLKDGCLIMLPAGGEEAALKKLDALDRESGILGLGFARIDLRDSEMVVVRPREDGETPTLATGRV